MTQVISDVVYIQSGQDARTTNTTLNIWNIPVLTKRSLIKRLWVMVNLVSAGMAIFLSLNHTQ